MFILAAIAGITAATTIYSIENLADKKICQGIDKRRAAKEAAAAEADQQQAQPTVVQQPAASAREQMLEQQLAEMQAAFAALHAQQAVPEQPAQQPSQAETAQAQPTVVQQPMAFAVGDKVGIADDAQLVAGTLADTDSHVGIVRAVNDDGTVRVAVNLGGKKGVRMITLSEYDVAPIE